MWMAQRLGVYAAVTQLVFGVVLGAFASIHLEPGFVPRGTVLPSIFALPAIVGWIGARHRRPALVGAAAVTSGIGAFIAFSGVTLIFLLPAAMFLVSVVLLVVPARGEPSGGLVSGTIQGIVAAAVCALVLAAGAAALLITDSACWVTHEAPLGAWIERLPYSTGPIELGMGTLSGGCSTGLISPLGVGLGSLLGTVAVVIAAMAARRSGASAADGRAPAPIG